MQSLDEYEKSELEIRLKKSKDLSEWKQIFAMIGYDDGSLSRSLLICYESPLIQWRAISEIIILIRKLENAVHPEYQSKAVSGWIKKGECKTLQTTGKPSRLHFAGALSLERMQLVVNEYESVNGHAIIDFFKKLENESTATTVHVILDNARAQKNKKLDKFLETSKIKGHDLPPYFPNLNPIERLWKILREATGCHRDSPLCKDFFESVRHFLLKKIPSSSASKSLSSIPHSSWKRAHHERSQTGGGP